MDLLTAAAGIVLVLGLGVVFGTQYVAPDKRMLALVAAAIVVGIAWRLDLVSGIGLLVLALPFPRGTVFGSTNFALILLLLVIWLLRAAQSHAPLPRRTALDLPVLALFIAFVVSFYNIESVRHLHAALSNFLVFIACVGLFYLMVNNLTRPEHLERLHRFQAVSSATICLLGLFELNNPGGVFIPGWIVFQPVTPGQVNISNVRIGGPFFDFELLSEYCALNLILVLFLLVRARSMTLRVVYGLLFTAVALVMFATVTRGSVIALAAGIFYLMWVLRRRLRFVALAGGVIVFVLGFQLMNFYVANFTNSGDLIARLLDPQTMRFEGVLPESRAGLWISAFQRALEHPLIGHGPYYSTEKGLDYWFWPHNGYLYIAHIIGFLGLGIFLWLMWRLWCMTRTPHPDLGDPDYARAFLLVAHIQILVFAIDQLKIDFMRNPIYQFQIWILFATIVAAHRMTQRRPEAAG